MLNRLVLILTLCCLHTTKTQLAEPKTSFLTQRDEEFVGPDKRLEDEIAQRRKCHQLFLKHITALEVATPVKDWDPNEDSSVPVQTSTPIHQPMMVRRNAPPVFFNNSRRIAEKPVLKDYDGEDIKPRMLQFQQHVILLTQDRLKDVSAYVRSVEHDERFRLPFIFNKLESWLRLMHQLYQIARDRSAVTQRGYITLLSYQRMLRHNIDITYTVAFLKHIQSSYIETVRARTGMTAEETLKLQKIQALQNSMSSNNFNEDLFKDLMQSMQNNID